MPNWCECGLKIEGDKKELQRFKKFAIGKNQDGGKDVLHTENFIPYPKKFNDMDKKSQRYNELKNKEKLSPGEKKELILFELEGDIKDGFNSGGYDWCCRNYGTKWGICHAEITQDDENGLSYQFDTAWSPPYPIINKMSELFPKLTFDMDYEEGGCGFKGNYVCENGDIIIDEQE